MASFNRVTLIGNLTRDPQIKQLPSSTTVVEFGMAMNRKFRTQTGEEREEVCFIDCSAFGRQAEVISQFCKKGKQIFLEGRLKYDQWDDKAGAGKRSKISVVVENFQFIGSRDDSNGTGIGPQRTFDDPDQRPEPQRPARRPSRQKATVGSPIGENEGFTEADIPF